ncbi:MAG: peptidylprolyl isomerase [Actinobacteria bacterium]|nr:peptidylprolyl isomerase [Actinomycetota bacterium]
MTSKDRERAENKLKRELEQLEASKQASASARKSRIVIIGAVVLVVILGGIGISKAMSRSSSSSDTASTDTSANSTSTNGDKPTVANCKQVKTISTKAKKYNPGYNQIQLAKDKTLGMFLKTNCGDIEIEFEANAPTLTKNMIFLANTGAPIQRIPGDDKSGVKNVEGYFDNSPCHRLTTSGIFVLQCGDPTGTGTGGPGYTVIDENMNPGLKDAGSGAVIYPRLTVAMANSGPDTNGSQFFIIYKDSPLPPNYSVIGTITKGMEIVDKVAAAGVKDGKSDGSPVQQLVMSKINSFEKYQLPQ